MIARAKQVLAEMEKQGSYEINFMNDLPLFALVQKKAAAPEETAQEPVKPSPVLEELKKISPDELTPKQALDALYKLKQLSEQNA